MASNDGFWSYVHNDDDASFGKIVQLGRDLKSQYEMVTGTSVELFLDRDSLAWGDAWESVIHSNLGTVAFFIPVITPAYFKSAACRAELERFAERTSKEGLKGLLLPILWVPSSELDEEASTDPLVQIVKDRQWEDWTYLRHDERGSSEYSKTLEKMAKRIQRANEAADLAEAAALPESDDAADGDEADDEPGRLEKLAEMEENVNLWMDDIVEANEGLKQMGEIAQARTAEMNVDPRARTFAGRLTLVRQIAGELQAPADRIKEAGIAFAMKVSAVDEGVRIIIDSAPEEIAADPEAIEQFRSFFNQLRDLDAVTTTVDSQLSGFVSSIAPLQKQSRDMKKPVEAATVGVTRIQAAIGIIHDWIALIDSAEIPDEEE
ncbi:hypothetical protein QF046_000040 [Microbacterium sp. W4I4]|uniref:toll/interleukin-1 receptor domain-containing protein n=1 Tax=Microbacterium sp. W4I4 TaxID=3042295 RepID=UPI00277DD99F|nr:toll/interleukin-1 receptor domain-containing protein [Microbacterium sp. W4I4]MDQ0612399.1 hypothetical protein [Microbacterium sp. W4I4]